MEIKALTKYDLRNHIPYLADLYKSAFGRVMDERTFEWRYIDNPIDELLFIVCKEDNKIIASYSASPCLMVKDNNIYKTALSLNTMTHPDYQGRGLFVELANRLYTNMKQNGYTMIWGFPNNISHRTFVDKLGWSTIYEVPTMTLNIDSATKTRKIDLVNDSNFELDYSILERSRIKNIYLKKDINYLRWRYTNNPNNKYDNLVMESNNKVFAHIVVKEYGNLLNIIDINYTSLEDAKSIINYAIEYAREINKDKVTIWAPINTKLHSFLEKIGFYNDFPIRYLAGRILNQSEDNSDFLNYNNWVIHAGDNNEY